MTAQIFMAIFVALSLISTVITEALKKATQEKLASNLLAAIVAVVVGGGGCVAAYLILAIPFTVVSIIGIVAMVVAIWAGSMLGYDKIKQLIEQVFNK